MFITPVDNGYACADCHTLAQSDTLIRPGHSLVHAAGRADFWMNRIRGKNENILNAALYCAAKFQTLELEDLENKYKDSSDGIDPSSVFTDSTRRALKAYLESLSPDRQVENIKYVFPFDQQNKNAVKYYYTVIGAKPTDLLRGEVIFKRACVFCHGKDGEGVRHKGKKIKMHKKDFLVEQIRFGGVRMPFFQPDKIADDDLASLVEYVFQLRAKK